MKTTFHPNLQAKLSNLSEEQIEQILTTEVSAESVIERLKPIQKMLTNPNVVTIEGWVARDEDGFINLFNEKPIRDYADRSDVTYGFWDDADGHHLELPTTSFPPVTWATEPQKVRITITPIES